MVELFDAQLLTLRHSPKWSIPAVCAIARKPPPVLSLEAHLKLCKDNQELAPELIQPNIIFQPFYKGQGHRIAWWPQLFWATSSEYQGLWLLELHLPRIQWKDWNAPQFPYVSLSLDLAKQWYPPNSQASPKHSYSRSASLLHPHLVHPSPSISQRRLQGHSRRHSLHEQPACHLPLVPPKLCAVLFLHLKVTTVEQQDLEIRIKKG